LAAHGNVTLVANISSLSDAIGETDKTATSVLSASTELTSTAERFRVRSTSLFQSDAPTRLTANRERQRCGPDGRQVRTQL